MDSVGNIYIADLLNHRIVKADASGRVILIIGDGTKGFNGSSSTAQFNQPGGIAIDSKGNIFIADSWNHRIRKIDPSGEVSTFAGMVQEIIRMVLEPMHPSMFLPT